MSFRIVLYTSRSSLDSELFKYIYAHVAGHFDSVRVVAVEAHPAGLRRLIKRYIRKMRRIGFLATVELISGLPLQWYFLKRHREATDKRLRALDRPCVPLDSADVVGVPSVNGNTAVHTLERLEPDVVIQAGAGILKARIFEVAKVACINLHHGISPLIRGMQSIYWSLWEDRPEWLGTTVHRVDEGIDTGEVLAYAPIQRVGKDESYAELFTAATEDGVAAMLTCLSRLQHGERWQEKPPAGGSNYRSTFSGWRLLLLSLGIHR